MSTPELAHLNTRLNKKDLAIDYVLQDMGNVAELWSDAHVEMRIKLQRMIFPKGLSYDLELKKFGTPPVK